MASRIFAIASSRVFPWEIQLTSVVFLGRSIGISKLFKSRAPVASRHTPLTRHEKGSLRVNINTATIVELQTLPGIGPARARLIVANRRYQSVDDLAKLHSTKACYRISKRNATICASLLFSISTTLEDKRRYLMIPGFETRSSPNLLVATLATLPSISLVP